HVCGRLVEELLQVIWPVRAGGTLPAERIGVAECQNAELLCPLCGRDLSATVALRVERRRTELRSPDQRGVVDEVPVSKRVLDSPFALVHHLDLKGLIAVVPEAQKPLGDQQRCGDAPRDQ